MRRSTLAALSLLGLLPIFVGAPPSAAAPEAVAAADPGPLLKLKSGQMVSGTVVGSITIQGASMWKVETDFGELLVPRTAVSKQDAVTPPGADATFLARQIRVVRLTGDVQRRPGVAAPWEKVSFEDPYSKAPKVNAPNALVGPGDTVRTGPDGKIDLMLHKDVWVHIGPNSEVEIPSVRSAGSLSLLRGDVVNQVNGRPRGEVFRVRTPSTVLGVRGTFFSCRVGEHERVSVRDGMVQVGARLQVGAGQQGVRGADGTWVVGELSAEATASVEVDVIRFPIDRMALVPAGTYKVGGVGQDNAKALEDSLALPSDLGSVQPFEIQIEAYLIDRREATRSDLESYRRARSGWPAPSALEDSTSDWPATDLTETECREFPRWCGKSIPLDSQWEVVARGHDQNVYPWGNKVTDAHRRLHISPCRRGGWPVLLPPSSPDPASPDISPFGLLGMASDPTEYCLGPYRDAVHYPHRVRFRADVTPPEAMDTPVMRGRGGSTRDRFTTGFGRPGVGIRCIVDLR